MSGRNAARLPRHAAAAVFVVAAALAGSAAAQTAPAPTLGPICADRPTKSNGPCTVDPGHFQIEADLANASLFSLDGVETDTWLIANPTLKYGVAPRLDIEGGFDPIEIVRTHVAGARSRSVGGIGDFYARVKYEFIDAKAVQAALIPYLKAPIARAPFGNGAWEGGLIAPVNLQLSQKLSLTVQPELDVLENSAGDGRHPAFSQDVNLGLTLPHSITVFAELWAQWSFDPAGLQRQVSADVAAALGVGRDTQLDAGVNFGLDRLTPGVAPYVGVSHRF